jgi:RHS repeat-associated protein
VSRKNETGLDYFGARYFSAAQGRFTSPDEFTAGIVDPFTGQQVGQPGPLPYSDITDPQTLNKYAYVRNNPLRFTDPDGHCTDVVTCGVWVGQALGYGTAAAGGALAGLGVWLGSPAVPGVSTSPNPGHYFAESIDNNLAQTQNGTQGRDAQGKFVPAQPGQSQPGAGAEKDALAAEGATKTGTTMPGTDRKVDGTVAATGQKIEVKSGGTVANITQINCDKRDRLP